MGGVEVEDMVCAHGRKFNEECPGCPESRPVPQVSRFEEKPAPPPQKLDFASVGRDPYFRCSHFRIIGIPCLLCPSGIAQNPPLFLEKVAPTDAKIGIGGGPTRATILPVDAAERKKYPIATGLLDYFPDALAAISNLSYVGNEQHNPGQPVHWARGKSTDEADTMMRHFLQRGTVDIDGIGHSVKLAWRCLAFLQKELESK